jgi:hypothetical protein
MASLRREGQTRPADGNPRFLKGLDRHYEGLRKAGMPEE